MCRSILFKLMSKKTIGTKYEYELSNRLGQGAFAEVYKGRNKETNEAVAIKVIKRSILARYGEDMLQQIHREIQVLQQLVQQMRNKLCPFVNKIFECLETSNHIYIVLEYCNEGTLLTHIKKRNKRIPEDEAVMILYQLASALDFITEGGVAHRDIKPENVFIKDGVFKLGDFGFAGQKQMYQTHLGTYPYMAPEFFNSKQYDGPAVDVWALGCMFHEMLFNEIYFIGTTQYEVSMKVMNKPYVIKGEFNCSAEVRDLLPRMIEKDKSKRITAKEIIQHPLFNKAKASPEFIRIMAEEKAYMDKFFWSQEGGALEQSMAQPIPQQPPQSPEQGVIQNNPAVQLIIDGINSIRNGIFFILQLNEFLEKQFINECRYEVFYLYKQSLVHITRLKERLDEQDTFTEADNVDFAGIDAAGWKAYYADERSGKLREDVAHERGVLYKQYIDYFNYINNHTQINYPDKLQSLQQMTNLNLQEYVSPNLFVPQMHSTITFFAQVLPTVQNAQERLNLQILILWLYTAAHYDQVFQGRMVDFEKFMNAYQQHDFPSMKASVKV